MATRTADGSPRTVLVTAHHVLAGMPEGEASIGYRQANPNGTWSFTPKPLKIRDEAGEPLWTHHPSRDVAAISIKAPPEFARAAIPARYLAADGAMAEQNIAPGDELMVLGFPRGLAANGAGFPILRSGRVASYPVSPEAFPTFLLDFSVFPGNSGGPVFISSRRPTKAGGAGEPMIAGLLTQQVELNNERLEIGIVTHARYIVETLALMENAGAPVTITQTVEAEPMRGAKPASQGPERRSFLGEALHRGATWLEAAVWRPFRSFRAQLAAWIAPEVPAGDAAQA